MDNDPTFLKIRENGGSVSTTNPTVNLTTVERKNGPQNGKCFECGRPNHLRRDCGFLPSKAKINKATGKKFTDAPKWVQDFQNSDAGRKYNPQGYIPWSKRGGGAVVTPQKRTQPDIGSDSE